MITLLVTLAHAACPSIDAEVERATLALVAGNATVAGAALDQAEASFACAPATNTQLARYWLVEGAAAHLAGEAARARAALAAARAIAPDLYDDRLGPVVRATWSAAEPPGNGTLLLEPPREALVNGQGVTVWPVAVPATDHVVQVLGADGQVRYGRLIRIGPGEDAVVETGLAPEAESLANVEPPKVEKKKSPALLILAGVAAAGAGAFAGGALAQQPTIDETMDVAEIDEAFGRQQAFGYTSYGLMGAAAAAVTLHFVIR